MNVLKCSLCNKLKDASLFTRRTSRKRGYSSWCKSCSCEYQKVRSKEPKHIEKRKERVRKYAKRKRLEDPIWRTTVALRTRLAMAIKQSVKSGSSVRDLGCSIEYFRQYISSMFQPGMTWENWGKNGWHIDHMKPLASFDLTDRKQFLEACHYTNLQPLWAIDNIRKGKN